MIATIRLSSSLVSGRPSVRNITRIDHPPDSLLGSIIRPRICSESGSRSPPCPTTHHSAIVLRYINGARVENIENTLDRVSVFFALSQLVIESSAHLFALCLSKLTRCVFDECLLTDTTADWWLLAINSPTKDTSIGRLSTLEGKIRRSLLKNSIWHFHFLLMEVSLNLTTLLWKTKL